MSHADLVSLAEGINAFDTCQKAFWLEVEP
jgi:hypothetical protein